MSPQALAGYPATRPAMRVPQPAITPEEAEAALRLPVSVADRIARMMAGDPGLAAAVTAQLPAARAESARQLAGYAHPEPQHLLDTSG